MKTTNYYNTFISVADDCPVTKAEIPLAKEGVQSTATIELDMLANKPYKYTSDDVLFTVYIKKHAVPPAELHSEREKFFLKGQPCFRSSPLTKRYGWGVHNNADGKIAIYAVESNEYKAFRNNEKLRHFKALRSKRA